MSKGLAWLAGLVALVLIATLIACGSLYNPNSNGLVVVASQGSSLIETFSFDLATGSIVYISNPPADTSLQTCVLNGIPSSLVLDPTGTYAYAIITQDTACSPTSATGIESFKLNTDGTIATTGTFTTMNAATVQVCGPGNQLSGPESVAVVPNTLVMDLTGKYLFVSNSATTDHSGLAAPGAISVFAVNNGALTEVAGSPFTVLPTCALPVSNFSALTPTPSLIRVQNAACSGAAAPTQQFLYATDSAQDAVWEFSVNMSTGVLQPPPNKAMAPSFPTRSVPSGVVVDPCNRFVYVSNFNSNQISAFTICNGSTTQAASCPLPPSTPDGSLVPITGSPFSLSGNASGPGPMVVDALGNFLYVLNELSNNISPFAISPVSGSLAIKPVAGVGNQPRAMALRSDNSWLFVTNSNPPSISQFALSSALGTLIPAPATTTDNYPWGVAVK